MGIEFFFQFERKRINSGTKTVFSHRGHQKYVTNNFHRNKYILSMKACISYKMLLYRQCGIHRIVSKLKAERCLPAIATAISIFIGSLNGTFELHYRNGNGLWAMKKNDNRFARSNCKATGIGIGIVGTNLRKVTHFGNIAFIVKFSIFHISVQHAVICFDVCM